jgi:hypothetical protein
MKKKDIFVFGIIFVLTTSVFASGLGFKRRSPIVYTKAQNPNSSVRTIGHAYLEPNPNIIITLVQQPSAASLYLLNFADTCPVNQLLPDNLFSQSPAIYEFSGVEVTNGAVFDLTGILDTFPYEFPSSSPGSIEIFIPEPITILLLGVGGLVLRRRK